MGDGAVKIGIARRALGITRAICVALLLYCLIYTSTILVLSLFVLSINVDQAYTDTWVPWIMIFSLILYPLIAFLTMWYRGMNLVICFGVVGLGIPLAHRCSLLAMSIVHRYWQM